MECAGTEERLSNCSSNGVGVHNCAHSEDAGVRCETGPSELYALCTTLFSERLLTLGCSEGDIRLEGSLNNYEGRVEICYDGAWGTVCDDSWGSNDAAVVCRQLGIPDASKSLIPH